MDKRIHMLLEDAENDLSKKEVLGILMHIIAGTYQLMDQSFYLCIPVEYRDIRIRQEDEKEILNRLISIINKKGDNMEYAMNAYRTCKIIKHINVQKSCFCKKTGENILIS